MPNPNQLIESLSAALIGNVASFFESVEASEPRQLNEFNPGESATAVYVIYSASGQPLAVGHAARSNARGRQAPPADVAALRGMDGMMYRVVEVGNEELAAHLSRIIGGLFGAILPFNGDGSGQQVVVNHEEQVTAPAKRRGRKPGKKGGAKRGRRAAAVDAQQDGVVETAVTEQPKRRGRKPGSKNKVKGWVPATNGEDAPKRRGRPPGSRTKKQEGNEGGGETPKRRPGRPRKSQVEG